MTTVWIDINILENAQMQEIRVIVQIITNTTLLQKTAV